MNTYAPILPIAGMVLIVFVPLFGISIKLLVVSSTGHIPEPEERHRHKHVHYFINQSTKDFNGNQ